MTMLLPSLDPSPRVVQSSEEKKKQTIFLKVSIQAKHLLWVQFIGSLNHH